MKTHPTGPQRSHYPFILYSIYVDVSGAVGVSQARIGMNTVIVTWIEQ
jgi:hypothetical protein